MMVTSCVNVLQSCFNIFCTHDRSWNTPMLKMKTLNPIPIFNSLKCHSLTTSPQNQFTVSYLVTNLGFSLETATKASKRVHFKASEKPDSVITIFRSFGFSKFNFCLALFVKSVISKSRWDAKVVVFKRWGWSDEMVLEAFRNRPTCMLSSTEKINNVMRFWVNDLGWNSSALVKRADIFLHSLENKTILRACVISYLISKCLIENNVQVATPFSVNEKVFLEKYVQRFKEERHNLLKLYLEKMDDGKKIKENGEASVSY